MRGWLGICLLIYAAASLLHHVHNAEYLAEYPNMPAALSPAKVYLAWAIEMAVGLGGYVLLRLGHCRLGLALIALSALAGFAGLDHYVIAPFTAHTATMHLTIGIEVAAAAVLLLVVGLELSFRRAAGGSTHR